MQQQQLTEIRNLLAGMNLNQPPIDNPVNPHVQQARESRVRNNFVHLGNHPRRIANFPAYDGESSDDDIERIAMHENPRETFQNNNYRMKMGLPSFNGQLNIQWVVKQ
ncbi:hypothetical protein RHMOL_Rhmol04G0095100 [Rhododendron molle]|uniref:Uncharacterized protein n=1 Tax=Rhododendron molle TaxID=49168 RepID=A0ACC0NYK1_RHOML|nr:hypothetical protein RHMOL_Rhmol04G0095100 [Rhododendron molle]